jgi:hypothetical protein
MIWPPRKGRLPKQVCRGSWPSGLRLEDRIGAGKLCLVGNALSNRRSDHSTSVFAKGGSASPKMPVRLGPMRKESPQAQYLDSRL